ncbi:MAG: transcription antitermination factor NusB [Flavobacteriales bacterium]|nr:transcription antitermination factor NusB [Flavobacteriales bacterium]
MLNRRFIRIRVLQALYAFYNKEGEELSRAENELIRSMDRIYDLYALMLELLISFQRLAENRIEEGKRKRLPTHEDLHPNLKFVENPAIMDLIDSDRLRQYSQSHAVNWGDQKEFVKMLFRIVRESELYAQYLEREEETYKGHRDFLVEMYAEFVANNETLHEILEEKSIYWVEDLALVNSAVVRTLQVLKEKSGASKAIEPLYRDVEDKDFAIDLMRKVVTQGDKFEDMIADKAKNWEMERIAQMDMLLMKLALAEFLHFKTIPVKVSMNEYIELSKEFSTNKSKVFINGILDKLVAELKESGELRKLGRGLIE